MRFVSWDSPRRTATSDFGLFLPAWPSSVWNHTNVESLSKAAAWSKVSVDVGLPDRRILILEFSLKPTASIASVATGTASQFRSP